MTIKDDLSKYPCFLYQLGTIRPIPELTAWSQDMQLHHWLPKGYKKNKPKVLRACRALAEAYTNAS